MKKIYMLLALFQCCWLCVYAQNITVTGTVVDPANGPLPAVSIKVNGSNQGTISSAEGKYSISVPPTATLTFSYLGFRKPKH